MKIYPAIFLIFIWHNIFAQNLEIQKTWVGDDLEYIKIDSQWVHFEVFKKYPQQKRYYLSGDTLRLYDKYTTSRDNFSTTHIKNYDFLITKLTETDLALIPLDSNSLEISGDKEKINYRERHLVKANIDFELIKFRSTNCFGECPAMTLQIDKEKKLMFSGGRYAVKQGFYTAFISDSLLLTLISLLSLSELDKLQTYQQNVADAPEFTLEVHYNGKIKYIKNFFLPAVTWELIQYLLEIPKKVELTQTEKPFEINFIRQ